VGTVDSLFTNGIVGMFADSCKVVSILAVIFVKSTGLGLLMLLVTPLLFIVTRAFQKRMLRAQMQNRAAVGRVNNHVPETIRSIRMIHVLRREPTWSAATTNISATATAPQTNPTSTTPSIRPS
jgi:ATP-binding cassette subfamily B protein